MKTRLFVAVLIAVVTFGFAYAQDADALTVNATWTHSSGSCFDATFSVYVTTMPNPSTAFALAGTMTYSGVVWPIQGIAVLNATANAYRVSLFNTSATGETFTFGFLVNATTLAGTGNYQRIAHGSVDADCPGTISGVTFTP